MDGNGRWARQRDLPRLEGHRQGAESVRAVLRAARACEVPMVTLFAFSAENWQRPTAEVNGLWDLLGTFLDRQLSELIDHGVRLRWLGQREGMPTALRERLEAAVERTANFTEWHCNLALNYSSRMEVVDAVKAWGRALEAGQTSVDALDWDGFAGYLYTAGLPDPDLLIRTSGEARISNFLLLQLAYAELHFSPVLWPDFGEDEFAAAIRNFQRRERRYGLTGEQLAGLDKAPFA